MAVPNIAEILALTIEERSRQIADNVEDNNALLAWLKKSGNSRPITGGSSILEELSFAENTNVGWYSGYDTLSVAAVDTLSAAEFDIKQCAVPVVISGLEQLKNAGRAQMIDLMESRLRVAEQSMHNLISTSLYSDGTGSGGKEIVGLDAAAPTDPTTGTYGGIDRATWTFWRSQKYDPASTPTATTIQGYMNTLWTSCLRGADRPNLILAGSTIWATYMSSLQALQRFAGTETAKLGFTSVKYMDADVVLDGGIGGNANADTMYYLNTKYLHWRPHKDRNMVPLSPNRRMPVNQDAEVQILAWAGALTCSGSRYQGRLIGT
jgi:hypothetical protein